MLLPSEGRPTKGLSEHSSQETVGRNERSSKTYGRHYSELTFQEIIKSLIPAGATPIADQNATTLGAAESFNNIKGYENAKIVESFSLNGFDYAILVDENGKLGFFVANDNITYKTYNGKNYPAFLAFKEKEPGIYEAMGGLYGVSGAQVKEIMQTMNRFFPQGFKLYETASVSYDGLAFQLSQLKHGYKIGRIYDGVTRRVPISFASNLPSLPNVASFANYEEARVDKATAEAIKADIDKLLKPYGMEATIELQMGNEYAVFIPIFTVVAQNDSYEDRIDKIEHPEAYTDVSAENTQTDTQ
ncbi:MAG: hypothetical protein LBR36_09910, partial [Bacteroidales bacterium]|nr:hypothetical protein [Bacteroidales bacterium]